MSAEPPPDTPPQGAQGSQWIELVEKIRHNDAAGMEELYRVFSQGVRFHLCRQLGSQDLDDKVHECFLIVAQAIRRGDLREPERLMGYVRTVVRRQVAARIEEVSQIRRQQVELDSSAAVYTGQRDPEQEAIDREHQELARRVLKGVSSRDREVLIRFYLREQVPEQICREMGLTDTQFRLLKSRAKARFGELGRRRLTARRLFRF
jgi:RNA polymerase sigma factor (sigma-70 family)